MPETWFEPVRAYCERGDPGFWAEPLNALSNGAFLLAAAAAAWRERALRREGRRDPSVRALILLVVVIGIGSFLFHTFANRLSMLADVIPIAVFVHAYFLLAMRRFLDLGTVAATVATGLFLGLNLGFVPALDALAGRSVDALTNGSIAYLPAALALLGVGWLLRARAPGVEREAAGLALVGIAALFLLSLTFRTADAALCPSLPVGTHFLWHLLNAVVLYGLIATALRPEPMRVARRALAGAAR